MRGLGSGGPTALCRGCRNRPAMAWLRGSVVVPSALVWPCSLPVPPWTGHVALRAPRAWLRETWPPRRASTPGLPSGPPPRASTSGLRFAGRVWRGGCPWERQPCTCGTGSGALAGREQGTAWARDVAVALGPRPGHLGPRVPFPGPLVWLLAASAWKPFRRRGQGSLRSACSVRTAAASAPAQAPGGGLWPGAGRRPSLSCRPRPHCCVYPSPCL